MIPKNAFKHATCSCQSEKVDPEGISSILEKHGEDPSALLTILGEIQAIYRYLPQDALRIVAERTGCSLVDVYGAATFYRSFSLKPKGKHLISVCMGTACHVRGAPRIVEEFQRQLGIGPEETTEDGEFSLETPNCLGACALGPIVVADGKYYSNVNATRVSEIIAQVQMGLDDADLGNDIRFFPINASCLVCGHSLMDSGNPCDGHPSIGVSMVDNGSECCLRLSSIYGRNTAQAKHDIAVDTVVEISCPHCQSPIGGTSVCPECEASMAEFAIHGGGTLRICSRWGCNGHSLDLNSPERLKTPSIQQGDSK